MNYKSQIVRVSPLWHVSMKSEQGESIGNSTDAEFGFLFKVLVSGEVYLVNEILWNRGRVTSSLFIAAEKLQLGLKQKFSLSVKNQTKP